MASRCMTTTAAVRRAAMLWLGAAETTATALPTAGQAATSTGRSMGVPFAGQDGSVSTEQMSARGVAQHRARNLARGSCIPTATCAPPCAPLRATSKARACVTTRSLPTKSEPTVAVRSPSASCRADETSSGGRCRSSYCSSACVTRRYTRPASNLRSRCSKEGHATSRYRPARACLRGHGHGRVGVWAYGRVWACGRGRGHGRGRVQAPTVPYAMHPRRMPSTSPCQTPPRVRPSPRR